MMVGRLPTSMKKQSEQTISPLVVLLLYIAQVSSHPRAPVKHSVPRDTCDKIRVKPVLNEVHNYSDQAIVIYTALSPGRPFAAPSLMKLRNSRYHAYPQDRHTHLRVVFRSWNCRLCTPPEAPREGAPRECSARALGRVPQPPRPPPEAPPPNRSASVTALPPLAARAAGSSAASAAARAARRRRHCSTQWPRLLSIHADTSALYRDRSQGHTRNHPRPQYNSSYKIVQGEYTAVHSWQRRSHHTKRVIETGDRR